MLTLLFCVRQGTQITYDGKTEKEPLYFLYGNVLDRITYGNAMFGTNKLTAEVNDEDPTVEVTFILDEL